MSSFDLMAIITLMVIITLLASLLYLAGLIVVLWRQKFHPQAAWVLFVYLLLSLLWSVEQLLGYMGALDSLPEYFLARISQFGLFLLAILFLFLTRAFLRQKKGLLVWVGLSIAWIVALAALDTNLVPLPETLSFGSGRELGRQAVIDIGFIAGWAFFMGGATLITVRALGRIQPMRLYAAITYWVLVMGLMVLGDGLFFAGSHSGGNILRLAGTMLAVFVVSMPRLPEIEHLLRRSVNYIIYAVMAILVYTVSFILAQYLFRTWSILSPLWVSLSLALLLVLLLNPILARLQNSIREWISPEIEDPTFVLRQYSQSITNILDLQLLATVSAGVLSDLLEIRRAYLFVVETEIGVDKGSYYSLRGVTGMGENDPIQGRLSEDNPLAGFFQKEYSCVTQYDIEYQTRFGEMPRDEQNWLISLGADIYVPILAKNEWIGLLALGPKGSGAAYTGADIALLSTLADQTAVALENTRLVEGLVRLNNDFRRAYSALDQANRHLERLDKTKSDFISIASHELRTPLTLISGSSQMLLEEDELRENDYYMELLSKLNSGSVRLHEIVDSMLEMAKIDARALELDAHPIPLNVLINSVCDDLNEAVLQRKQILEMQDLEELPPVAVDETSMRKVFFHLIINAVKYTPDGGRITVTGRVHEPDLTDLPKGGVEIEISDTGIGIDPRFHELIFRKFYQTGELALHSSGKTKFKGGGPGLGLAIASGIVEAHHGKIWVDSPGYDEINYPGSQFHVLLPLRQPPAAARTIDTAIRKKIVMSDNV